MKMAGVRSESALPDGPWFMRLRHEGASLVTNISNVIEYTAVAPGVNVGFVANAIF